MKFDNFFEEVQYFSDGSYVITGYIPKEEALEAIKAEGFIDSEYITLNEIEKEYVMFGFPPETVEGYEEYDKPIWYTGANPKNKGAKAVWVYHP